MFTFCSHLVKTMDGRVRKKCILPSFQSIFKTGKGAEEEREGRPHGSSDFPQPYYV